MEKVKISTTQLFVLVVLFEMGSAILVGIASGAKQDAWIAVLLGLAGGIVVFFIYYDYLCTIRTFPYLVMFKK